MRYLVLVMALALSACTMGPDGNGGLGGKAMTANPITGGDVSVTALSGPPGAAPAAATGGASKAPPPNPSKPQPAANTPAAQTAAQTQPSADPHAAQKAAEEPKPEPPPASPEEAACRKKGGQWSKVGKGGQTCVQRTRDAGKACTKATQCEGLCLARSGTCAPINPLFGCNDILQNDGSQVTLCID